MEDVKRAILLGTNPQQNYSNEIKQQAQKFLENIIVEHSKDHQFFFQLLKSDTNTFIKFWALSGLETILRNYYSGYTAPLKMQLHEIYFQFLEKEPSVIFSEQCIESKYSLLFSLILRSDYPEQWPDAFTRLLSLLKLEVCSYSLPDKLHYLSN